MRVGDLVKYTRDNPASYAEFEMGLKTNDLGLVLDSLGNGTTVFIRWIRTDQEVWMGENHLEVVSGRQETESD